ncbi:MAG TPA: DUF2059 domain-containing protein [Terracidiphilus sp.]|nr:DUF2059 domain-containing protein [Terracidiphilus sp.]
MIRSFRSAVALVAVMAAFSAIGSAQATEPAGTATSTQLSTVAANQEPTKEQLAKLFDVMRIREQMQSMRQIVPGMVSQQIRGAMKQTEADLPAGTKLTPEQHQQMQDVMSKYVGKAMDLYPADEMMADMTTIYQQHLSKDDVDGLIAFYSSPAGQHLLNAQPVIAKEYMPMVMEKVTERSQAMTKEMMKEMAEIVPAKQAAPKPAAKVPAKQ